MKLLPSKEQIPLVVTLGAVILLGLGYYFVYLPGNESDLQQWKFRTLQNIDKNVHDKIDNGQILLRTYLGNDSLRSGQISKLNSDLRKLKAKGNFPIDTVSVVTPTSDKVPNLMINEGRQLILTQKATVKNATGNVNGVIQLSITFNFTDFIKPILPDSVFDHYIIVSQKHVLYETFRSGFESSCDSLVSDTCAIKSAMIVSREIGGIQYKLFIQPVNYGQNNRMIFIGLLSLDHYQQARSKLPSSLVLLLILIFTGILITFPIIKLYQLGNEDRLTTFDAMSCTAVSMVMISLLFFTFIKYSSIPSIIDVTDPKEILADNISKRFSNEIKENSLKLITLDSIMASNPIFQKDIFGIGKKNVHGIDGPILDSNYHEIQSLTRGLKLDRIFWMDSTGQEKYSWKSDTLTVSFPGKFDKRPYFQTIKRQQGYHIVSDRNPVLYVDQVISWISNSFLTVISTQPRLNKFKVVAMSFTVSSLDQIKVPPGYRFAVIDEGGKVLYHSDKAKNLNENLFSEFSNSKGLTASIKTGSSDPFKTSYFGHNYAVRVSSIGHGLPYSIVIFDDLKFEESRDIDVHGFTLSMQILLLILVVAQMLVLFFASSRRSTFKAQKFDTGWLSPKKTHHPEYVIATAFNLWTFLILIFSTVIFDSIIAQAFTLLFSITTLPVVLNLLYFKKHDQVGKSLWSNFKSVPIVASGVFPLLILITGCIILKESWITFVVFELLLIVLPVILVLRYNPKYDQESIKKFRYNVSFTAMVFSWMLVVNGLPVIFFFASAYNYDQHLIARYKQLELARKITQAAYRVAGDKIESNETTQQYGQSAKLDTNGLAKSFYRDAYWIKDSGIVPDTFRFIPRDDETVISMLNSFHLYDTNSGVYNRDLYKMHSFDFSFFFNNLLKQVNGQSDVTETYFRLNNEHEHLKISSSNLNLKLPHFFTWRGAFAWFLLIATLAGLFFLILGLINKLFSLKLPVTEEPSELNVFNLLGQERHYTFLIALPGSWTINCLAEDAKKYYWEEVWELDMSLIPGQGYKKGADKAWKEQLSKALEDQFRVIVISHFEFNFRDPYTTCVKLSALEKIMHEVPKARIIILSAIRPATLINVMNDAEAKELDKHSIEKWQYLIGRFQIIIQGLQYQGDPGQEVLTQKGLTEDAWIFNEQTSNYHYYYSIWQSLSREEKFLLFDLAEDGLVNSYDKGTICLLISKGIIIQDDGALRLFSKAFRNFVLTGIGDNETEKIMEKVNDNRNWNKIAMPLALVSLAIVAFILSSQNEASTKLITTLGALAAAVPTIINFLATLGGTAVKKT